MAIKVDFSRVITKLPSWEGETTPCDKCGKAMYGGGGPGPDGKYVSWKACFNRDCEKMNGKQRKKQV